MFFATRTDKPRPSMYTLVTMVFRRIQCTCRKLGHKVLYNNYACVFIDIDQLKGKPMQNLVKIYTMWFKDLYEHFRKLL